MTNVKAETRELSAQFLQSLDKTQIGAAASKLFHASVGEIVTVFSRSPSHKHYSLADIEWMVAPAVLSGQFYVVEAAHRDNGFRSPIAAVTWAFVSAEVDRRLAEQATRLVRLRPDEWTCGEIGWLIDAVGGAAGIDAALQWLKAGPFKERALKIRIGPQGGGTRIEILDGIISAASKIPGEAP
jgi:hemolysin-activating ACP:hemolysin acyltransferase